MSLSPTLAQKTVTELRDQYGIRFHHFHDRRGRLVATIATEPSVTSGMVRVAAAFVSKKEANVSRKMGRHIALARLYTPDYELMAVADLKAAIANRTILLRLGAKKLGPDRLRPRQEFVPKPVFDDHTMAWVDDDLPF